MSVTAREIMTRNPITIAPEAAIMEAVKVLLERRFNGLPVVDGEGKVLGVICQSDLVAQQKKMEMPSFFTILDAVIPFGLAKSEKDMEKITATTVEQAMTKDPVTATPDDKLEDLASLMVKAKYYSIPVVENGKLVGIIGKEDILRTVVRQDEA